MELVKAVKMPFQDWKKLLIGWAILFAGMLIVVLPVAGWIVSTLLGFFVSGFVLLTALNVVKKKWNLTEWADWKTLFIKGILMAIIGLVYMLPALLVIFLLGGNSILNLMSAVMTDPLALAGSIGGLVGALTIGGLLVVLAMYLTPSAVLNYGRTGKFLKAFDFKTVLKKAFSGGYFLAAVVSVAATLAVMLVLLFVPVLNLLLLPLASFVLQLFSYSLLAEAVR